MTMNFGFSSNAFQDYTLTDTIEILANVGYDGVEILLDEPHLYPSESNEQEIERIQRSLDEHGLVVSNCNAFMLSAAERSQKSRKAEYGRETEAFHHPSFIELDADDRQKRVEHTKTALRTAAVLDAPHISIPPGGPVPARKSDEQAMDEFVNGLQEVAETAEAVGVDILVEPEPDLLIETSEEFLELMDRIDSPRVGCNFDAGHFFSVGENPAALVEKLSEFTHHYHLEDIPADRTHVHTQLGEGAMNIDEFLAAVEETDYEGFVTVELYPYQETAAETAHDAMQYLQEHDWT